MLLFPQSKHAWASSHAILTRKYKTLYSVTKKNFKGSPLTIYTKIVNNDCKFILQVILFQSRDDEFTTFLLETMHFGVLAKLFG